MKIKIETFEELQKNFPIGMRLAEEFHYVTEERF